MDSIFLSIDKEDWIVIKRLLENAGFPVNLVKPDDKGHCGDDSVMLGSEIIRGTVEYYFLNLYN